MAQREGSPGRERESSNIRDVGVTLLAGDTSIALVFWSKRRLSDLKSSEDERGSSFPSVLFFLPPLISSYLPLLFSFICLVFLETA